MILDFTVGNFRSIKEPVTLSAVAQTRNRVDAARASSRSRSDYDIAPARALEGRDLQLLPVLAIIGPNASGKSNLLGALTSLLNLMRDEQPKPWFPWVDPFDLDRETANAPAQLELRIGLEGTVYEYSLLLHRHGVVKECLRYLPPPPAQWRLLFEHRKDNVGETARVRFGPSQPSFQSDPEGSAPLLQAALRANANLQSLSRWLADLWRGLDLELPELKQAHILSGFLGAEVKKDEAFLSDALRALDTGIERIVLEPISEDSFRVDAIHRDVNGLEARRAFSCESVGTRRVFGIVLHAKWAMDWGIPLIVDDFEASLSPEVVRYLIRNFQRPEVNRRGAQLIFASHDTSLMKDRLLRRDEIWFTSKRRDGSTDLYPLTDFHPRNDLALDRAYLDGRFGAVPVLPDDGALFLPKRERVA
jgi:AAA15 family ATPase/GTPase